MDPLAAEGKLQPPTLYMASATDFFRNAFSSKPFAFQKKPESYYRKTVVPRFHEVLSERFLGVPKQKQTFWPQLMNEARTYYLDVLVASVKADLSEQGHDEALALLCCYVNYAETTREGLVAYLNKSEISEAIAEARCAHHRMYQLLSGWKEMFGG